MLATAFGSSQRATQPMTQMAEEKRGKSKSKPRKPRKQGWFKPGSAAESENSRTKRAEKLPEQTPEILQPDRRGSVSTTTTDTASSEVSTPQTPRCIAVGISSRNILSKQQLLATPTSLPETAKCSISSLPSPLSMKSPGSMCVSSSRRHELSNVMEDSSDRSRDRYSRINLSRSQSSRSCLPFCSLLEDSSDRSRGRTKSRATMSRTASTRSCVPSNAHLVDFVADGPRRRSSMPRNLSTRDCMPICCLEESMDPPSPTSDLSEESLAPLTPSGACDYQIVDALMDALDNDRMADVTLLGRNGARVRATKFVLACQSQDLRKILYTDPSATEVYIGPYGEPAIRALKDFCCTGQLNLSFGRQNASVARGLTELASMCHRFRLPPLYDAAESMLFHVLDEFPSFATASFDAASGLVVLQSKLVEFFRARSKQHFLETDALKHLSHSRLGDFVVSLVHETETTKFQYIQRWVDIHGSAPNNLASAKHASKKLSLDLLLQDPTWEYVVRSSGLFKSKKVDRILKARAEKQAAADENDDSFALYATSSSESTPSGAHSSSQSLALSGLQNSSLVMCMQLSMEGEAMVMDLHDAGVDEMLREF